MVNDFAASIQYHGKTTVFAFLPPYSLVGDPGKTKGALNNEPFNNLSFTIDFKVILTVKTHCFSTIDMAICHILAPGTGNEMSDHRP